MLMSRPASSLHSWNRPLAEQGAFALERTVQWAHVALLAMIGIDNAITTAGYSSRLIAIRRCVPWLGKPCI